MEEYTSTKRQKVLTPTNGKKTSISLDAKGLTGCFAGDVMVAVD